MEFSINCNASDQTTGRIADVLCGPFEAISKDLSKDYGGTMNHLWIDFELVESHAQRRPPWSFRFQKRVTGSSAAKLTGLPMPVIENVGHYSVRPDFQELRSLPLDRVVGYALNLIYASTSVLTKKQKRLGGFDAERFRSDLLSSCRQRGYQIAHPKLG